MPTIITAHMANTNANSIALHGAFAGAMIPMPAGRACRREPELIMIAGVRAVLVPECQGGLLC
jgi:hypothetical protein